jgi:hypothetical protein
MLWSIKLLFAVREAVSFPDEKQTLWEVIHQTEFHFKEFYSRPTLSKHGHICTTWYKSWEVICNHNGEKLRHLVLYNNIEVMNTFFQHKNTHR